MMEAERKKSHLTAIQTVILVIAASVSLGGYVLSSHLTYRIGFPLDDAWIHQTYARNLAQSGEWAYVPGVPSAGSTSPLWSALLALGYLVGIQSPYPFAFLLGWTSLTGIGIVSERLVRKWLPSYHPLIPLVGLLMAVEWHLVWAAGSGMETSLYALAVLTVFERLSQSKIRWWLVGVLVGLTIWIRPDALTLMGPVLFLVGLQKTIWINKLKMAGRALAGLALLVVPYGIMNYLLAGSLLPNTFFAKQAEYAILINLPLIDRLVALISLPWIGMGLVLVPGFFWIAGESLHRKKWLLVSMVLWWVGITIIYALRLPVAYQHGRYLIPAMPVFFILGFIGVSRLILLLAAGSKIFNLARAGVVGLMILVGLGFYGIGAVSYGKDVAIIESEMVQTAVWLTENSPPDAVIAAHDIGAIGYFSNRRLLDLAGLVSPEVIPFIRDEPKLAAYLNQNRADYLVTFPGWYPVLTAQGEKIFQTKGIFSPAEGGENMAVYRWRNSK